MLRNLFRRLEPVAMARKMPTAPLLVVLGATGTGKSELAVDLATRFDGEIINGDAMQMYAGLPIITNKIPIEEQKGIPHHLLACIGLDEEPWHTGTFKKNARKIVQEIRSRGKIPILVGGTHYYTQSLLFEDALVHGSATGEGDHSDNEVSTEELKIKFPILAGPTEAILEKLRHVDPIMAQRWHPNDRRKIQRSLEIFLTTGKKASEIYEQQKQNQISKRKGDSCAGVSQVSDTVLDSTLLFWVYSEPESLKLRLDVRVDKMVESGLLDEVQTLDQYLQQQKTLGVTVDKTRGIWASIGWKEFDNYLTLLKSESPLQELDAQLEQSIEQVKAATRQYARRQVRWIRVKLMDALSNEDALDNLYLLDGSDITVWKDTVSGTAIQITERFLAGAERPIPSELSEVAKDVLAPNEAPETSNSNWVQQECELCHVIGATENQWQDHLKSRRHRALIKRRSRNLSLGRSSLSNIGDQEIKTKVP